jgi:hypothetical protein
MKKINLTLPQLIFVAATRGALGVGIGLLAANRLRRRRRRIVGSTLAIVGALTTIPAAIAIFRSKSAPSPIVTETSAA